jgi:hypothetical protein
MPDYKVELKDGFTFHTPDPNLLLAQEGKANTPDLPSFFAAMPNVATITNVDNNEVFTNPTVEVDPDPDPAPAPVVDPSVAIIESLNAGNVISDAELLKITDPNVRSQAATRLARNIVTQGGSTQDVIDRVRGIFGTYFDTPASGGFGTWAESVGFTFDAAGNVPTADTTAVTTADSGDSFDISFKTGAEADPTPSFFTNGTPNTFQPDYLPVTEVPDEFKGAFATAAEYNAWRAKGSPGEDELLLMYNQGGGFGDTPFTTGVAGDEVGGPATMDIFGQMQTQENFPADVFRRFLAEQVSPGTEELQALSPFMMRGAQDLAPQLMSEYSASIYDPSNWSDAGSQSTFGDWLRAGQRPTRQGMFNTLQDIGNVVAGGQQGITAPGLSMAEGLRRQNIINQFGTDTAESRKALQGLFSTAALKGVAPAFRYPVQSAAQNLFQTQRALQPEQSFLSFLGERL